MSDGSDVIALLNAESRPLHVREIRRAFARRGEYKADYELLNILRILFQNGQIERHNDLWKACKGLNKQHLPSSTILPKPILPPLSEETRSILTGVALSSSSEEQEVPPPSNEEPLIFSSGPWGNFRALIGYYCDCIRNDGRAEAKAALTELNESFLFLTTKGTSLPRPGLHWSTTIPLGEYLSKLIQKVSSQGQDALIILGYPLQISQICQEGEHDIHLLKPIFYVPAICTIEKGALAVRIDEAIYQVNLDWLEYAFNTAEKKRSFLSACGFLANDNEDEALSPKFASPAIEHLTATLTAFCSHRLRESLQVDNIIGEHLRAPLNTGIYNRAVLMVASRPQYTQTLLRELKRIRETTDEELDITALRFLFREVPITNERPCDEGSCKYLVAENIQLNNGQREAVHSLLNNLLTVITGPPGTGKSQVVSAGIVNAHLHQTTVLFASRNHKAIDAVYGRCRDLENRPLLTRCNSREDPSLRMTFAKAVQQMLQGAADQASADTYKHLYAELLPLLGGREEKIRIAKVYENLQEKVGRLESQMANLESTFSAQCLKALSSHSLCFPSHDLARIAEAANNNRSNLLGRQRRTIDWLSSLFLFPVWLRFRHKLAKIPDMVRVEGFFPTPARLAALHPQLIIFRDMASFCDLRHESLLLEPEIRSLPDRSELTESIKEMTGRIIDISSRALVRKLAGIGGLSPGEDRETLANLRTVLKDVSTGLVTGGLQATAHNVLRDQLPRLFHHFPCWAVTNLSAGSHLPLLPGIFDLVVLDEASQSDIPSAIPLLFRARRAGVVGDPHQLTHVTNLPRAKDAMLRRRAGLGRLTDQRFSYLDSSIFTLFADTTGVNPFFLRSTYRSVAEIADYSNELFYSGRLEVETDTKRLPTVPGMKQGLHWSEIDGEVKSAGSGGAWCQAEIEQITTLVRDILNNGFQGTIGVVTPFREQANRLRDAINDGSLPWESLQGMEMEVSTSHGFQGGERDVIFFSLCAGPGMPQGALNFLRETGNLFNVAVSRARAVLHVVGNQGWAAHCGIRHIEKLARPRRVSTGPSSAETLWAPHESIWEKRLYQSLEKHGINPIPQYPIANRRLDLALVRPDLRIDIEVDGATYHRNPDGTRKIDDVWRDMQIMGMGWKVLRFWVYQLREDMDGCVQKIIQAWSKGS